MIILDCSLCWGMVGQLFSLPPCGTGWQTKVLFRPDISISLVIHWQVAAWITSAGPTQGFFIHLHTRSTFTSSSSSWSHEERRQSEVTSNTGSENPGEGASPSQLITVHYWATLHSHGRAGNYQSPLLLNSNLHVRKLWEEVRIQTNTQNRRKLDTLTKNMN